MTFDSYLYDGVNQYADIPDNAAYSIPTTGALTVSVWLKQYTNQFTLSEGSGYANVLGKSDFGSPNHVEWQMRLYNLTNTETDMRGSESSFYVFSSAGGIGVSSDYMRETTDVGRWIHYLATMDGTYVRLYKDGVLQEVANYIGTVTPADTIAKIYVAHADNNGYYYGEVGPIKIWNRVLSQSEVTRQSTSDESNTTGLVGHWLADSANLRLTDQTAAANHGTLRNSPTFVSSSMNSSRRIEKSRKQVYTKQAINLNGTTQYGTIADASQTGLDVDDKDFLITGWVKFNALSSIQTLFAKVDTAHANAGTAGAVGYDCIFNTGSNGQITFRTRSNVSGNQTASYRFPRDGGWHHFAVVFKRGASGKCQLWLDNIRVVNFSSFAADMGNDGVFRVGASSGSAISQFLNGSLSALHFYTWTAGTMPDDYQNIIDDVYNKRSTTYTNGLVSTWKFDGDVADSYGTNNLTATATPTYSAALPTRSTAPTTQVSVTNILSNPSFEANSTGWALDANFTRDTSGKYIGSFGVSQSSAGGFANFTTTNDAVGIAVTPGLDYVISVFYKSTVSSGNPVSYQINSGSAYGTPITSGSFATTAGVWTRKSITFNSGAFTKVWIRIFNNGGTVTNAYDNFMMETGTVASAYCEGTKITTGIRLPA